MGFTLIMSFAHTPFQLWLTSERQKYQRSQVRKVIKEQHNVDAVEAAPTTTRHGKSFSQPGDRAHDYFAQ